MINQNKYGTVISFLNTDYYFPTYLWRDLVEEHTGKPCTEYFKIDEIHELADIFAQACTVTFPSLLVIGIIIFISNTVVAAIFTFCIALAMILTGIGWLAWRIQNNTEISDKLSFFAKPILRKKLKKLEKAKDVEGALALCSTYSNIK